MPSTKTALAALLAVLLPACADDTAPPTGLTADLSIAGAAGKHAKSIRAMARLGGEEEVPPTGSRGRGHAAFWVNADTTELSFRLVIGNIENTTMAHIHKGPPGVSGPIVVWLRPSAPPPQLVPGRFNGVYAHGTVSAANLVGPLAGQPLSALITAMQAGSTYVNVHTSQFPAGEIRGQIGNKRRGWWH